MQKTKASQILREMLRDKAYLEWCKTFENTKKDSSRGQRFK